LENLSNLRLTFEKVDVVLFAVHDTLVDTEVVVFEIKVADVAADLKRVGHTKSSCGDRDLPK
jgi:hypothetical protein